jgi:chitinase
LSLGGWGGCKTCSDVFSSDSGRLEFAESVLDLTNYFQTDGIDRMGISSTGGLPRTPVQSGGQSKFHLIDEDLRNKLGKSKEISVICAGLRPSSRVARSAGYCTYVTGSIS